ncbi:MAG TPA: patatin family protein, partial [Bacteroidales bacterium]|nr:patatin family protein [Bacteroidales bacterium]
MEAKKEALILEGGGFRGLYTSGVLDVFLKHQIHIPFVVGVSAGAAYGISYVSKQPGRNLKVNQLYRNHWRYEGWYHWLFSGNLFNWPFVFGEIPRRLVPFDYAAFFNSGSTFEIAVTDCHTGKEVYLNGTAGTPHDLMKALTAAASLPILSK